MKTGRLRSLMKVAVVCFLLLGFRIGTARQTSPPKTEAPVSVVLRDGSLMNGVISIGWLEVQTVYGKLIVPISEVKAIRFAEGAAERADAPREVGLDEIKAKAFSIHGTLRLDTLEIKSPYGVMNVRRNDLVSLTLG